jgi:hypothetical protein
MVGRYYDCVHYTAYVLYYSFLINSNCQRNVSTLHRYAAQVGATRPANEAGLLCWLLSLYHVEHPATVVCIYMCMHASTSWLVTTGMEWSGQQ